MQMVRIINRLQTLPGYDVLKAMVGSGFVGQDELTEALRAFGEHSAKLHTMHSIFNWKLW